MELIPDLFFFFFLNQTHEGSICALGRFVQHFLLLSSVFQSVKENSKLFCRGPSLNITGWEGKFLEDLLPPKAEAGMVCLGKWCFYSKWNQVGSEGTAFQWWASHWNYVLHRHSQVYSQARWACTNSLPLHNTLWIFRRPSSQWYFLQPQEATGGSHLCFPRFWVINSLKGTGCYHYYTFISKCKIYLVKSTRVL